MGSKAVIKSLLLVLILALGFILQRLDILELEPWKEHLEGTGELWWMPLALILLMIVFYALALPGTLIMLSTGVIYTPVFATLLSTAGGVLGAVAAFFVARFLSESWTSHVSRSPLFRTIQKHAGFLPLCWLRIFPGFPHSVINYSAGILNRSLFLLVASATVGFIIKGFVYTSAAHNATHLQADQQVPPWEAAWPLAAIVLLSIAGFGIRYIFTNGRARTEDITKKEE